MVKRRSAQSILAEVSATLASSLTAEDILATVARQIGEAMGVFSCDIWEYEPGARHMTFVATWCAAEKNPYGDSVGDTAQLDGWDNMLAVVEGRQTVELHSDDPDLPPTDRASFDKWGFQSTSDTPLVYGDRVIGVLGLVETRELRRFSAAERELFGQLAVQAAIAINNAHLYRLLQEQADTDGLTGLCNHRRFRERLYEEFVRARRYNLPLTLLMIDIDDFKAFNDDYGHLIGDEVLRIVARLLKTGLRQSIDLAARYGGEEFAVMLPNTPPEDSGSPGDLQVPPAAAGLARAKAHRGGAGAVAARIRHKVEITAAQKACGVPRTITVSIGVALLTPEMYDASALVRAADAALYEAKHSGKNTVVVAG